MPQHTELMFGVGMHFSVRDLLAVRRISLPGALWPDPLAGPPPRAPAVLCG
jgi:predicted Kef-type K+ transport protein